MLYRSLTTDTELPVKVDAAIALQFLVKFQPIGECIYLYIIYTYICMYVCTYIQYVCVYVYSDLLLIVQLTNLVDC